MTIFLFSVSERLVLKYRGVNEIEEDLRFEEMEPYDPHTMRIIVFILWTLVILSFVITVVVLGAPPALSLQSDRETYYLGFWGAFFSLNSVLYSLILFDRYQIQAIDRKLSEFYSITLYCTVFLFANKFQIFTLILIFIVMRGILVKGQKIRSLIILVAVAILIFTILYNTVYLKMYNFSVNDTLKWYNMKLPKEFGFIANPYLYIANNFDNLYTFISMKPSRMYGYNGVYNITRSKELCEFIFTPSISARSKDFSGSMRLGAMNTGSIFLHPYWDFGIAGVFIYAVFCGALCGFIERKLVENKDFMSCFAYCYAMIGVFASFFTDAFLSKSMLINLLAAAIISAILHEKIVFMFRGKRI
jgi:oligosaccharide repeat unit polymerase